MSGEEHELRGDVWDDLASGNLSDEEEALLRALAEGEAELGADDALATHLEAFAPLGSDFEEALARRVEAERRDAAPAAKVLELNTVKAAAAVAPPPRPSNVLRLMPPVVGVLALAAVIALAIQPWRAEPGGPDALVLPAYSLQLRGGVATLRHGEPEEGTPRFDAHSRIDLALTPAQRVDAQLEVAVFFLQGGRAQRLDASLAQVHPSGAIRVRAPGSAVFGLSPTPGPAQLALVIFAQGHAPDEAAMQEAIAARRADVWFADFEILAEAQP